MQRYSERDSQEDRLQCAVIRRSATSIYFSCAEKKMRHQKRDVRIWVKVILAGLRQ